MKQLLLTLTILFSLGATAQTIPVHLDSSAQIWCANIDPLPLATAPDSITLSQVRIAFVGSVPSWYAWLRISLCYQQPSTGRYIEYKSWMQQVNMPGGAINPIQLAFAYVRDTFAPDGVRLENIVYIAP